MKQSSIEWLVNEIKKLNIKVDGATQFSAIRIIEEAKEMHKQEVIDAYANGYVDGVARNKVPAEQYYNETFSK
jgi:hypothetical protein